MCISTECKDVSAPIYCKKKCERCYKRDSMRERRANPEVYQLMLEANRERQRTPEFKARNKDRQRRNHRRRRYGLSYEEFLSMLEKQDHKCAICGRHIEEKERDANVDHDHTTKVVRELLCRMCNVGIGHFMENSELLLKAADYLNKHRRLRMSIEAEVKSEVAAVEAKAETVAEAIATDVKSEVVKVEGDVKAEVAKVEAKVKAAVVNISAEEKLFLREAELEYLKATLQIQNFQKVVETKSKEYTAYIESLIQKYGLSKAEYTFDAVTNTFKKL